jgi:hypothetical protein
MTDIIKALMQQLVGVQGRDIARRQTPENTVHDIAGTRRDGAPPFEADEETVTLKNGRADRPRARAPALHRRPVHVGAIGEVEGHRPRIADL